MSLTYDIKATQFLDRPLDQVSDVCFYRDISYADESAPSLRSNRFCYRFEQIALLWQIEESDVQAIVSKAQRNSFSDPLSRPSHD